jgi:hypothetical protein
MQQYQFYYKEKIALRDIFARSTALLILLYNVFYTIQLLRKGDCSDICHVRTHNPCTSSMLSFQQIRLCMRG